MIALEAGAWEVHQYFASFDIAPASSVRVCSAEDLIIHKAVAGRAQDVRDIEGVVYRQGKTLDVAYIRHWLNEFAAVADNPDLEEFFEIPWQRIN